MVIIKNYNKRTFICQGITEPMIEKIKEFGAKTELLSFEGKKGNYWTFPIRKKIALISYFIMQDIEYKS